MENSKKLKIALFIYLFVGLVTFSLYQYSLNADTISYMMIAQRYLQGDFLSAINGVWGVLMSWLLVPLFFLGIDQVVAFKYLSLFVGFFTLIAVHLMSKRLEFSEKIKTIILITSIPIILSLVYCFQTPDLLVVCILLYYFYFFFNKDYDQKIIYGVLCGLFGGLSYLAKHYNFIFFLTHFILFNILLIFSFKGDKQKVFRLLRNFFVGLFIFLVISISWISILNLKYGKYSISLSTGYNYALVGPNSKGHGPNYLGFLPPPYKNAISVWEDPSVLVPLMENWSPLGNWINFKHQIKLFFLNFMDLVVIFTKITFLWPIILFITVWMLITKNKGTLVHNPLFFCLISICLYVSGYLLIFIFDRYILILVFFLLFMGAYIINQLDIYLYKLQYLKKSILIILVSLIFVISFSIVPVRRLIININRDKNLYELADLLRNDVSGRIAGDQSVGDAPVIAYLLRSQYYGEPRKDISYQGLISELYKYDVDYYFVWKKNNPHIVDLEKNYKFIRKSEFENFGFPDLKIYLIK